MVFFKLNPKLSIILKFDLARVVCKVREEFFMSLMGIYPSMKVVSKDFFRILDELKEKVNLPQIHSLHLGVQFACTK